MCSPNNLVIEMGVGRCTGRQPLFEEVSAASSSVVIAGGSVVAAGGSVVAISSSVVVAVEVLKACCCGWHR